MWPVQRARFGCVEEEQGGRRRFLWLGVLKMYDKEAGKG